MMRKITGLVLLFIGLSGLVVSVAGVYLGRQVVDDLGASIDTALDRTLVSLDTAADTLVLTKSTFDHVNRGLETVGTTAANVAQTLLDTQPFLDNVSSVVTTSIPDSPTITTKPDTASRAFSTMPTMPQSSCRATAGRMADRGSPLYSLTLRWTDRAADLDFKPT